MSTQYKNPSEVPDDVLLARVEQLVQAIVKPGVDPRSEFTMRVPAECDRDADIVLSELARRYTAAAAALADASKPVLATQPRGHSSPHDDDRFLAYCPEEGTMFFPTQNAAEDCAHNMIQEWSANGEGWGPDVDMVLVAQIVKRSTQVDRIDAPPPEELDEEGCDGEGMYWDPDWAYRCNYKLLPVSSEGEEAHDEPPELEKWLLLNAKIGSPLADGSGNEVVYRAADVRALLAGKVLCDAKPIVAVLDVDDHGGPCINRKNWAALSKIPAGTMLYAPADTGKEDGDG